MTINNKKLGTIMMKNGIHIIKGNKVKDIKINTLMGKKSFRNRNYFLVDYTSSSVVKNIKTSYFTS